jgi:hypothetical protein
MYALQLLSMHFYIAIKLKTLNNTKKLDCIKNGEL